MSSNGNTTELQAWLDRLRSGDAAAREELIARSCRRLHELARRMLRRYPRLRRWEQTDDVLQNAMIRLHHSLLEVTPESVERFLGFATLQIRRTLLDLIRHHFGPEGEAARRHTDGGAVETDNPLPGYQTAAVEPERLDDWTRFHEAAEALPEEEKQVFGLLWYQGLTQTEAASVLGVTERTVRRRWLAARCALVDALDGRQPQ